MALQTSASVRAAGHTNSAFVMKRWSRQAPIAADLARLDTEVADLRPRFIVEINRPMTLAAMSKHEELS